MLYQAVEAQFAALAPLRLAAETLQQFLTHPLSPATYTPAGRAAAAGLELFERATRRYRKPCFGLSGLLIDGAAVAVSEERSEEHTSALQSLMSISYAVFCLKKKNN